MDSWRLHEGQRRKFSNRPYAVHPWRVMVRVHEAGVRDEDVLVACLLHDVLEDQPFRVAKAFLESVEPRRALTEDEAEGWANVALTMWYGERVARIVSAVSKPAMWKRLALDKDDVNRRMVAKLEEGPPEAYLVKAGDRIDNLWDYPPGTAPRGYARAGLRIADAAERHVEEVPGLEVLVANLRCVATRVGAK